LSLAILSSGQILTVKLLFVHPQGLEHCIANCFLYQLALKLGGPPLPSFVVNNIIACTIGNVIGGGCLVAAAYSLVFGVLEKKAVGQCTRVWRRIIRPVLFGREKDGSSSNSKGDVCGGDSSSGDGCSGRVMLAELAASRGVVGRRSIQIRMPADVNVDVSGQVLAEAPSVSLQYAYEPAG
jgi:hypothetical protein